MNNQLTDTLDVCVHVSKRVPGDLSPRLTQVFRVQGCQRPGVVVSTGVLGSMCVDVGHVGSCVNLRVLVFKKGKSKEEGKKEIRVGDTPLPDKKKRKKENLPVSLFSFLSPKSPQGLPAQYPSFVTGH